MVCHYYGVGLKAVLINISLHYGHVLSMGKNVINVDWIVLKREKVFLKTPCLSTNGQ